MKTNLRNHYFHLAIKKTKETGTVIQDYILATPETWIKNIMDEAQLKQKVEKTISSSTNLDVMMHTCHHRYAQSISRRIMGQVGLVITIAKRAIDLAQVA
jgi:hypothetical protein